MYKESSEIQKDSTPEQKHAALRKKDATEILFCPNVVQKESILRKIESNLVKKESLFILFGTILMQKDST